MSCRDISPKVLADARTLEDVYRGLGVLRPKDGGSGEAPPRLVFPEGYTAAEMPYLSGNDHQTFKVGPLFANGSERLNCALKTLGYKADRARQIDTESAAMKTDQDYDAYMAKLSPQDALTYNVYRTLKVVDFFRTNPTASNPNAGGNSDGNPDEVTTKELNDWAWAVSKHDEKEFFKQGGDAVARLHALVGVANLISSAPVVTKAGDVFSDGGFADVDAPKGGWRAGDRVFVDGKPVENPMESGDEAFHLEANQLHEGTVAVEIHRANGDIIRTSVAVQKPHSFWDLLKARTQGLERASSNFHLPSMETVLKIGAGLVVGLGIGKLIFGRNRQAPVEALKSTPTPLPEKPAAPVVQVVVTSPAVPASSVTPPASDYDALLKNMPEVVAEGASGILSAVEPVVIEVVGDDIRHEITPENVVMRGADIQPTPELSRTVVMSQIASLYPAFCNKDGSVNGNFLDSLKNLADHAMQQFHQLPANADGPQAVDLWAREKNTHHSMVRGGLPELFLREQVEARLTQMATVDAPGMSFTSTQRGRMQSEAERLAGERAAFERSVQSKLLEFTRGGK